MGKSRVHKRSLIHGKLLQAHILFTDESPPELHPKVNRQNKRIQTSDPSSIKPEMRLKFPLKITAAGVISRCGKTELYIVPPGESVNGKHYCKNIVSIYTNVIINGHVFPRTDMAVLMQDRATCHTARATLNQIELSGVKVWTDWPGNFPDLNSIEHIWARLQNSVLKESPSKN